MPHDYIEFVIKISKELNNYRIEDYIENKIKKLYKTSYNCIKLIIYSYISSILIKRHNVNLKLPHLLNYITHHIYSI